MEFKTICENISKNFKKQHQNLCKPLSNKKNYNLSKLLKINLLHQESIKFGLIIEILLQDFAYNTNTFKVMDTKNINRKQIDLLVKNNTTNELHYFEIKSNLNLDSEKWKATIEKIEKVVTDLENKFNTKCHFNILTPWYEQESGMSWQYSQPIVMFFKDYIKLLGSDCSKNEWELFLQKFSEEIKKEIKNENIF